MPLKNPSDASDENLLRLEAELNAVGAKKSAAVVNAARHRIIDLRNMHQDVLCKYLELKIGKR